VVSSPLVIRDDLELLDGHARAIQGILAQQRRTYFMETTGGVVSGWSSLPAEDKRAILMACLPIPGILVAKLVFGASWPVAAAVGVMSAPVLLGVVLLAMRALQPQPATV